MAGAAARPQLSSVSFAVTLGTKPAEAREGAGRPYLGWPETSLPSGKAWGGALPSCQEVQCPAVAWSLRPSSCGERNENTQDRDRGVDAAGRAELRPKRERRPGRPRVDEPAAALLHEGAQSETRKTLVSNFSY